jgi:uncharacterized membrane protein
MSDCAHCKELLARAEKAEWEMEALRERIAELEMQVLQEQIAGVQQTIKQIEKAQTKTRRIGPIL